ncbi:MAG: hypothetical protein ACLGJA_14825 [Gammaproteobacteria bacterium]
MKRLESLRRRLAGLLTEAKAASVVAHGEATIWVELQQGVGSPGFNALLRLPVVAGF